MLRPMLFATLVFVGSSAAPGQELSVLHIKVVVVDAERKTTPVPRHALLVSDNPASAPPRRIITARDGTAEVTLRPGSYTVESDAPVAFHGRTYQWTLMVDVAAGRDATLDLTADNAEIGTVASAATGSTVSPENDPAFLLPRWQDSVVSLWTPHTRASGFLIDAKGLIATNHRAIGAATTVEVQLTPAVKVAARVLASDPVRDAAVLWIDPQAAASVRPVPLGCDQAAQPLVDGQEVFTIGAPLRGQKGLTSGTVSRMAARVLVSGLMLRSGSAGGPVFTAGGAVAGITSIVDANDESRGGDTEVVRIEVACDVAASTEEKMRNATPPDRARLPVEPVRPFPVEALKEAAKRRGGSLDPYQIASSDFDIAFITPVLTYGAQYQTGQAGERERRKTTRSPDDGEASVRQLMEFGGWTEYVADFPPVLLVRATPRLVEGFWRAVARGAAMTQGVSLPPIRRFKSGFARMRAFCGDSEVLPIHPFKLQQRISGTDAINEGLYVFDPGALGPQCGTVRLVLYSEKEPGKGDSRPVDAKVLQQIWQDFAPYRAAIAERDAR